MKSRSVGWLEIHRTLISSLRITVYVLAFIVPPTVLGVAGVATALAPRRVVSPDRLDASRLAVPSHDPGRPTVAIVMGNENTEITDFLGPFEIFSASEAFNVYAVAPERRLSPLSDRLDVMPHFSFDEFEAFLGASPDVIVIPYIPGAWKGRDHAVVDWIRANAGERTLLVSICAGAGVLAQTGLLDGRPATSHWQWISRLQKEFPAVRWTRNARYVDDGNVISSAGITAGMDVSFYTVKRLAGVDIARETARRLGYPHVKYVESDEYQQPVLALTDALLPLSLAYRWERRTEGLYLYDGVGEIDLSAVLDSLPASGVARIETFGRTREAIRSRHGLSFVPRLDFESGGELDRVLIPGNELPAEKATLLAEWAQSRPGIEIVDLQATGGAADQRRFPFDVALTDLARQGGSMLAVAVAKALEYPVEHLALEGNVSGAELLLRPVAIGLLGVAAAAWVERKVRARRRVGSQRQTAPAGPLPT